MKNSLAPTLILLRLSLFGTCTPNRNSGQTSIPDSSMSSNPINAADPGTDRANPEGQAREYDKKGIGWMNVDVHQWKYDFVDAKYFYFWQSLRQLTFEQYNLVEKVTIVDGES